MGRGLSDLQKDVLKGCLEQEATFYHCRHRVRIQAERSSLPMPAVVMLAGNGERTPSAEVVASKTIKRLEARGLVDVVDEEGHNEHGTFYYPHKGLRLTIEGREKAAELFPKTNAKRDRKQAASKPRTNRHFNSIDGVAHLLSIEAKHMG